MMEDGGGIFGSIAAGSTKGRLDGVLSSICAAPMAENVHSRRKINPITGIGVAEEERIRSFDGKCIALVFIIIPFI
jgi:hypothetical protein